MVIRTIVNRGRNLGLKNETSKFGPLFLCWKPRIQATFSGLPPFVEMGHPKRKIGKLVCKNENSSKPNPEFSYAWGFLFFYPVFLFRRLTLQSEMRSLCIVERNESCDSPPQVCFRCIAPAVLLFFFENGKERFCDSVVKGLRCPGKRLHHSKALQ